MDWFQRAATLGNPYAKEALGELYESGEFGPQDARLAFRFTREAAESGHTVFALYRLARMYEDGRGTDRDPAQALRWMKEAARFGIGDSVQRVQALGAATAPVAPATPERKARWRLW